MGKEKFFLAMVTNAESNYCRDCKRKSRNLDDLLKIGENIETRELVVLCDECLKNYEIAKEPAKYETVIIDGKEYIEFPCGSCPGNKFRLLKSEAIKKGKI